MTLGWVCHLIAHHFRLKQLLKWIHLLSAERWQTFLKSVLYLFELLLLTVSWRRNPCLHI